MIEILTADKERPVNRITISGTQILDIDLNDGWEISKVNYNDDLPANRIDELVVTFKKRGV